jgi:rhamnosyltransferase subunit B
MGTRTLHSALGKECNSFENHYLAFWIYGVVIKLFHSCFEAVWSANIMKIIMFAAGSDGDIHPHLGVGCELLSRGHQVVFVTSLNYVDVARECGFEAISGLGEEDQAAFEAAEGKGALEKIKARFQFFSDSVTKICRMVGEHIDDETVLIASPFAYVVARLLQLQYGTPYMSTALAPSNILLSLKRPPTFKGTQWFRRLPYPLRRLLSSAASGWSSIRSFGCC